MTNVDALMELLRIPSVSTIHQGIDECAQKVEEYLMDAGFQAQVIQTSGHPVVFGEKKGKSDKTLLFYDHYDVQPPEPLDEWESPPFEPEIRDNRLYARGVADNKGNIMARIEAVRAFDTLPVTIKFLIEGEEEIGSPHLEPFVRAHAHLLKADGCIWEAGYKDEVGHPCMYCGVKGLCYVELTAHGANRDLHSASAVIVESPVWKIVQALASLKDTKEQILIKGFYDDIQPPSKSELNLLHEIPYDGDLTKKMLAIDSFLLNISDIEAVFRTLYAPSCNICGILSGYTERGSKTVLPSKAMAKVDFRLVPDQDPQKIYRLLRNHLKDHGFEDIDVKLLGPLWPAKTPIDNRLIAVVKEAMKAVHHKPPIIYPTMSGSGPMWLFTRELNIPTVSIGVGDASSHPHSPNESINLTDYQEGIRVIQEIIAHF
jgi:acetylornithine deacetylase/succinyl-diaminopimelate desuccinylase-like protein